MRAWEFLGEDRLPLSPPVTLRALHKMKLEAQAKTREEQERYALMPLMYGNADRRRDQLELERLELEMAQLRAEIAATEAETAAKSAMVIHKNAKSGSAAMQKSRDQITKLAKDGLGRKLKV